MTSPKPHTSTSALAPRASAPGPVSADDAMELLNPTALHNAIFRSPHLSSIATDAAGVIRIFNVGAEQMLRWKAVEVVNRITPADMSDPDELVARAKALTVEHGTPVQPGFEALVFKASRGIDDVYELTYVRKDGTRFPTVVSVTAVRDARNDLIGFLLIGTDNSARKVQRLPALLSMCAWCKKIRDDHHFWQPLEKYFGERAGIRFSHGICPVCADLALRDESPAFSY